MSRLPRPPGRRTERSKYPLNPAMMASICRELASGLRTEAALEWEPIALAASGKGAFISRAEAAMSMDAQARRWEIEAAGGPPNVYDREKIGHDHDDQ